MTSSPRLDGDGEGLSEEMVGRVHNDATLRKLVHGIGWTPEVTMNAIARAALVAAGVPDLIAERDRLRAENDQLREQVRAAVRLVGSGEFIIPLTPSDNTED